MATLGESPNAARKTIKEDVHSLSFQGTQTKQDIPPDVR